jgi:hypothetical protein
LKKKSVSLHTRQKKIFSKKKMSMGFFDSVKDWASKKLASTEFVTYVEQATNEQLLSPNYDMFMVLVDAANDPKGEWVSDVVRSVRVRLDSPNPKVKLFTIELVSVLIQNCGLKLHTEVAESKGLLNAIVENACLRQDLVRGPLAEARKAAIQLIVNLDVWFKHHPARDKVAPLANLINEAKSRDAVFENVIPDTTTNIITDKYPRNRPGADTHRSGNEIVHANAGVPHHTPIQNAQDSYIPNSAGRTAYPADRAARQNAVRNLQGTRRGAYQDRPVRDEVVIVEAIPVEEPDEGRRSGMFEAVMLLGEVYHTAKQNNENIRSNEMITMLSQQVQEDFLLVSMLVNSGAILEQADTLNSLYESQRTILRSIRDDTVPSTTPPPVAPPTNTVPLTKVVPPSNIVTGSNNNNNHAKAPPPPPPAKKSVAPTLDELFAQSAPSNPPGNINSHPNDMYSPATAGPSPKPQTTSTTNNFPSNVTTSMVNADGSPMTARRRALPDPSQSLNHGQKNYVAEGAELVEMGGNPTHSPMEGPEPGPNTQQQQQNQPRRNPDGSARTAADVDGNDFDAFLNARLNGPGS